MNKRLLLLLIGINHGKNFDYKKDIKIITIFCLFIFGARFWINKNNKEKVPEKIKKFNNVFEKYKNTTNIKFQLDKNDDVLKNIIYFKEISYMPFKNTSHIKNQKNENLLKEVTNILKEQKCSFSVNKFTLDFQKANEAILNKHIHYIKEMLKFLTDIMIKNVIGLQVKLIGINIPSTLQNNTNIKDIPNEFIEFFNKKKSLQKQKTNIKINILK